MCSAAIFETSFSYDKDICIAATAYFMHFYIIMLCPLTKVIAEFIHPYLFTIIFVFYIDCDILYISFEFTFTIMYICLFVLCLKHVESCSPE